ncbi:MAG: DUF4352 domain-containing protein [Armatimonadota bacterium]
MSTLTLPMALALAVTLATEALPQATGNATPATEPTGTLYVSFGGAPIALPANATNRPDPGYMFFRVGVALTNLSNELVAVRPEDFRAEAFAVMYEPDTSAGEALVNLPRLRPVTLAPGGRTYGYLAFQVPSPNQGIGFFWNGPPSRRYFVQMQESRELTELAQRGAVLRNRQQAP